MAGSLILLQQLMAPRYNMALQYSSSTTLLAITKVQVQLTVRPNSSKLQVPAARDLARSSDVWIGFSWAKGLGSRQALALRPDALSTLETRRNTPSTNAGTSARASSCYLARHAVRVGGGLQGFTVLGFHSV